MKNKFLKQRKKTKMHTHDTGYINRQKGTFFYFILYHGQDSKSSTTVERTSFRK